MNDSRALLCRCARTHDITAKLYLKLRGRGKGRTEIKELREKAGTQQAVDAHGPWLGVLKTTNQALRRGKTLDYDVLWCVLLRTIEHLKTCRYCD